MLRLHAPWGTEDDGADAEEDVEEDVAGSGYFTDDEDALDEYGNDLMQLSDA